MPKAGNFNYKNIIMYNIEEEIKEILDYYDFDETESYVLKIKLERLLNRHEINILRRDIDKKVSDIKSTVNNGLNG